MPANDQPKTTLSTRLRELIEWHRAAAVTFKGKGDVARTERHDGFEETLRAVHAKLTKREKAVPATVPTWEEVAAHALQLGLPEPEARGWFLHFEANGWKVSGKTPMKKWKASLERARDRWKEKTPTIRPPADKDADPSLWNEFLRARSRIYERHNGAPNWLKSEFNKWRQTK